MKHTLKVTAIILAMFVVTQFIGLYVVNYYSPEDRVLPFGLDVPEAETQSEFNQYLGSLVFAFVIAILLLFFLMKFKVEFILKLWFFVVVVVALSISLFAILPVFKYALIIILLISLPLAFIKIYKRNFLVHNATELFIYPGIAAVFVSILNIWTIIGLLILISIYDMWAVWHSGIMQKMAKYQINKLKIFSGFFVPYASKKVRQKIKLWKSSLSKSELKKKRIRVNVAILGGGDVIFPIIASGVMLKTLGIGPALLVLLGATIGLAYLFFSAEKKKFYPAMPFITAGIFVGMIVGYILFSL